MIISFLLVLNISNKSEYASYSALWYGDYQCGREVEITIGGGYLYVLDNGWLSIYDLNGEKVF